MVQLYDSLSSLNLIALAEPHLFYLPGLYLSVVGPVEIFRKSLGFNIRGIRMDLWQCRD